MADGSTAHREPSTLRVTACKAPVFAQQSRGLPDSHTNSPQRRATTGYSLVSPRPDCGPGMPHPAKPVSSANQLRAAQVLLTAGDESCHLEGLAV